LFKIRDHTSEKPRCFLASHVDKKVHLCLSAVPSARASAPKGTRCRAVLGSAAQYFVAMLADAKWRAQQRETKNKKRET
jgi:hypothetical protein